MNFSKTTEYALQIMSFIAAEENKFYSANEIYEALQIPFRYLRKQMTILSKTGLIESKQGKYGGYRLSKKTNEISLLDIVNVTEVTSLYNICFFAYQNCSLKAKCRMHDKWVSVRNSVIEILKTTSLKDIKDPYTHQFISNNNLLFT